MRRPLLTALLSFVSVAFVAHCSAGNDKEPSGKLGTDTRRCPVGAGVRRVTGDKPFGVTAYGYGFAGSYAFTGGADVKPIYTPPPLK